MSVEVVNRAALLLFSAGLLLGAGSVAFRMWRLHRAGIELPRLIWRDVVLAGGLGGAFVAIGLHRLAGLPFANEVWWAVLIAGAAVVAVWTFVYYEFWVIGHRRDGQHERRDDDA